MFLVSIAIKGTPFFLIYYFAENFQIVRFLPYQALTYLKTKIATKTESERDATGCLKFESMFFTWLKKDTLVKRIKFILT